MIKTYLNLGWHLFPLQHKGKAPLTSNGFKDASNNPDDISDWAKEESNWGVATGASGLIVVDLDVHKGGTRAAIEAAVGALPDTVEARTGSGGTHLFYKNPGVFVKTRLGFVKGVDVLAATGYVVLPPSIHPNGTPYSWVNDPACCAIADAPQNLLRALQKGSERKLVESFGDVPELELTAGMGRWGYFQRWAGILRALGWGQGAIHDALLAFYQRQCEPDPTLPSKIRDLAHWICNKPAANTLAPDDDEVTIRKGSEIRRVKRAQLPLLMAKGWFLCGK